MSEYVQLGILFGIFYIAFLLAQIQARNQETSFMIKKLLEHEGVVLGRVVEPSDEVKRLAATKGAEVEAIKAYREQTGLGLKEARAVVQGLSHTQKVQ